MKVSFTSFSVPNSGSVALLVGDGAKLSASARQVDEATGGAVSNAIKVAGFKGEAEKIDLGAPFAPLHDLMIKFLAAGGRIAAAGIGGFGGLGLATLVAAGIGGACRAGQGRRRYRLCRQWQPIRWPAASKRWPPG